jgi:opacity protein-like surface antigen
MRKLLVCACALLAADVSFADANEGFYSGAAISRWQYKQLAPAADARLETFELNAGFWFHPLLSAEVRAGTGLGDREAEVGTTPWELNLDYFTSVYWRPEWVNNGAKLYGLVGYSQVQLSADAPTQSIELSDSGLSFGVGVGFTYQPDVKLNVEWKQLVDTDGFEISGFTAGLDYRF